jgi:tRNA(Ile)-lysidine synthase
VALLRALAVLREEFALRPLVIAHLNHRLRGEESDADQDFVEALYRQLAAKVPQGFLWRVKSLAIREGKAPGENLESAARDFRYQWLTEVAQECDAAWIVTGHTAGDQAETVLHRLLRGTGISGLSGIPPRRVLVAGVEVIRPMLEVDRIEVSRFLNGLQQSFRQDSSNRDMRFTRNRIRHELLPLLQRDYNPAIVDILCRLAQQAQVMRQDSESRAAELLRQSELPRAGSMVVFAVAKLQGASRHQLAEMFRFVWQRENWPQQDMGFREWSSLAGVALGTETAADLPGPIRIRNIGRVVQLCRLSASQSAADKSRPPCP